MPGRKKGGNSTAASAASSTTGGFSESDEAKLQELVAKYDEKKEPTADASSATPGETKQKLSPQAIAQLLGNNTASNDAAQRQAKHQAVVDEILKAKGEAGVQEALRLEIAKTKKLESEVAQSKKKIDNAKREHDQMITQLTKLEQNKAIGEGHCQVLLKEIARMKGEVAKRKEEDAAAREEVRERITGEISKLETKLNGEDENLTKVEAENVELREKFNSLKEGFDAKFAQYEEDWKMRETQTKLLIQKTQMQVQKTDRAQAEWLTNEKQLQQLQEGTIGLKTQYELFASKLGEFEEAAVQQDDVAAITARQMNELKTRLDEAEKIKGENLEAKKQFDFDANKLRIKGKGLKTKVQAAERAKTQAETKCREAQTKLQLARGKENVAAK